ncbi:MAG: hypothetical protein OEX04_03825 [Acidimicrobiia bacterium]|nr:hypothetical protein [Acidimicrobiia bacterium]MDH4306585.1 hypothetical protein [Acidimicrobiia bacterium]
MDEHAIVEERVDNTEIYRRHADELIRFATVLAGSSDAQDVVADGVCPGDDFPGLAQR